MQTSAPLQKRPSSQAAFWATWVHVFWASLQASTVQAMPSEQSTMVPATQPETGSPIRGSQDSLPSQNRPF
ncbi:MAG: hypothetical protein R3B70_34265 [Polyangiaceae bacterium]